MYVHAKSNNQPHMVLAYYQHPNTEPLILDNLTTNITLASRRTDLKPVYSFNDNGVWINRLFTDAKKVSDINNVSLWLNVKQRIRENKTLN